MSVPDLNNDNYPDLIIFVERNVPVRVILNQRNKTFASPLIFSLPQEFEYPVVRPGHFNEDPYVDLVCNAEAQHRLYIYSGPGDGRFNLSQVLFVSEDVNVQDILCADVNNDGLSDLIIIYYLSTVIDIFINQNDPIVPVKKIIYSHPLFYLGHLVSAADMNQDGHVNLVISTRMDGSILMICQGHGDGTFSREAQYPIENKLDVYTMTVGDWNHDGVINLVISLSWQKIIIPYLTWCCDPFTNASLLPNQLNTKASFLTTGDFNRDNRPDLIVSYQGTNQLGFFLSHGDDTFESRTLFSARSHAHQIFITVADLNNADQSDLVVFSNDEELIDIYFSDSIGASTRPRSLFVVDFNNDTTVGEKIRSLFFAVSHSSESPSTTSRHNYGICFRMLSVIHLCVHHRLLFSLDGIPSLIR